MKRDKEGRQVAEITRRCAWCNAEIANDGQEYCSTTCFKLAMTSEEQDYRGHCEMEQEAFK